LVEHAALMRQLNELFGASQAATSAQPLHVQLQKLQPASAKEQDGQDEHAAKCLVQVASALVILGQLDLAQRVAELALRTNNGCDDSHDVMANVHQELGNWDVALEHRKSAMRGSHAHRLKLGMTQLAGGELEEGFANYEARLDVPTWLQRQLPTFDSLAALEGRRLQPGDPIRGRHILVFTEQELGDAFFGARFLPILAELGAEITLVCRAPLRPFFTRLKCLKAILSPPEDRPHAKINLGKLAFDAWCPMLSLPHALGTARNNNNVSNPPYLSADPVQVAAWRARYAREGRVGRRKVGVVWQINSSNRAVASRSMCAKDVARLALLDNMDLVNLQHGPSGRELSWFVPQAIDAMQEPLSLDAFGAALAATDVVISVDTMAAHCAGAIGHPVWVALSPVPAWYWGLRSTECVWYPTARLFRQTVRHNWSSTVEAIAARLQDGVATDLPSHNFNPRAGPI
jgi:hypothetical protein